MGLKLAQDAGRVSATEVQLGELLEACRSAEDTDESEELRQAHAFTKSINRSFSSASSRGDVGKNILVATTRTRKAFPCPSVQTEKIHEVPFTGVATSDTGRVNRWFYDRSFGFITPEDGRRG